MLTYRAKDSFPAQIWRVRELQMAGNGKEAIASAISNADEQRVEHPRYASGGRKKMYIQKRGGSNEWDESEVGG